MHSFHSLTHTHTHTWEGGSLGLKRVFNIKVQSAPMGGTPERHGEHQFPSVLCPLASGCGREDRHTHTHPGLGGRGHGLHLL